MERVDLVSVALMWCVGISALIQAVNARGHFRIAMSWILAAAIFAIAFFFSSLKAIDIRNLFSTDGPVQSVLQAPPPPPGQRNEDSIHLRRAVSDMQDQNQDSLARFYVSEASRLLKEARKCAESVEAFEVDGNLSSLSASKFEKEESRARSLRNQSSNLHRQARSLRNPGIWNDFQDDLVATMENLRLAGYEIHAQFGADEDVSSPDLRAQGKKHSRQALLGIAKAEQNLGNLKP